MNTLARKPKILNKVTKLFRKSRWVKLTSGCSYKQWIRENLYASASETNSFFGHLLHLTFKVIPMLMAFMLPVCLFFLKRRCKGSKDKLLLDMINKQQTSVNVFCYRHWMTGCNWFQSVWCNMAHYYANPASGVLRVQVREKEERQSGECETENECLSVGEMAACWCARLSVPLRSLKHKDGSQPALLCTHNIACHRDDI